MRIKFICLNLWLGGKLFDPILEFIKKENPDILAVQEVYDAEDESLEARFRSMEVIKEKCGFEYQFFSATCDAVLPEGKIPVGNAIFSHFPIVESNTIFYHSSFREVDNYENPGGDYSLTPRNIQHALIKVGETELNIFNTQGVWGKDSEDNENRLKMSKAIVEAVKCKQNAILCGDFNVFPNTETIRNIEKHLKNIFKDELETTFNVKQKPNPIFANFVVDMIFASNDLKVIDHYAPNVDVSDHLPLIVTFEE
ncbi:MAG: endonuclease/exonuclease/phosphatase family protein [Parcubacteria group bacterium]|jgi:endonuclease/exonuclease/phosphatase family metal-dependent hydrolase